jgi:para-aminobenzoate synthetase component I
MIFSRFKWNSSTILELEQASSAYIYYRSKRLNLLTGFPESYPFSRFLSALEEINLQDKVATPTVYHFYYEFGLLQAGLGHALEENTPLVIEIRYQSAKKIRPPRSRLSGLPLEVLERPGWSEYKEAFARVQEELLAGNCYQVNLTFPYDFHTQELLDPRDIADFFFSRKHLGAFAHCTYVGEEMILSNSPECLFQYRDNELFTMPIKGTIKRSGNWRKEWEKLFHDPKEEGELLMITDLLKNDLNRLDQPCAEVLKLRSPLLVPGLLHQYALLSVKLSQPVSLQKTLNVMFPGGSITGAPKKRVMEIISRLERYQRGIYCGSTLLCYGPKKMASINIRTASISPAERLWRYGAGGGITLLSRPVEEFQEMESKVGSFLTSLKVRGY